MSKLVSICIPVYNGEQYIEETIKSLINQTYNDIEIIISDNASTDRTVEIINNYIILDNRIKLLKSDKNYGYCKNIEKAVNESSSEYICIFHADDIYAPTTVAKEYAALNSNLDAVAIFTKSDSFNNSVDKLTVNPVYEELETREIYLIEHNVFIGGMKEFLPILLEYGNIFSCPSLMTYKSIYQKLGGYTDEYPSTEDLDLWIRYLKDGGKLCILNENLLHYRLSDSHASAYLAKKIEIPIEFHLFEEQVLPFYEVSSASFIQYQRRKARILVGKAILAARLGKVKKTQELLKLSRLVYRYRPWEKIGFLQLSATLDIIIYHFIFSNVIKHKRE